MCICVCLDNDENISMCICVCLDNDENAFHVHSCVLRQRSECFPCVFVCVQTTMRMFSMFICVCLDNDKNVFHVYLCVF